MQWLHCTLLKRKQSMLKKTLGIYTSPIQKRNPNGNLGMLQRTAAWLKNMLDR